MDEELNVALLGLGAVVNQVAQDVFKRPANPVEKRGLFAAAAAGVKKAYAEKLGKSQQFLVANADKLPQETKAKLAAGALKMMDAAYYIRKEITNYGIFEVTKDSDDKEAGLSNFSKQRLPDYSTLVVDRIELQFSNATSATSAKSVKYEPLNSQSVVKDDAAAQNSELEVLIDSKSVLKIPVNRFVEGIENVSCLENGYTLKNPLLITDKQSIQFRLHTSGNLTPTSGKSDYIEVVLKGTETQVR